MRIHTLQEAYERAFAELDAKPGYTVEQHSWGSTTVYTISVDGVEVQRVAVNPKGATGTDTLLDCIISQYGLDKETWPQEMCDLLNQSRAATKFISDKVEFLTLTGPHWGEARKRIQNAKGGKADLPEPQDTILEMWCAEYTAREIGEAVSLSPGTVRNKITRMRKELGVEAVPYHRK